MGISQARNEAALDWGFIQLVWMFLTKVFEEAGPEFHEMGLGPKQMVVLAVLDTHSTPGGLRDALGAPASTISNLLNELERKGLIERQVHPVDRRQYHLVRTTKGQEALAKGASAIEARLAKASEALTPAQIAAICEARLAIASLLGLGA